jgi:SET domain-containing protein
MSMEHLFLKRSKINGTGLYTKKRLRPGDRVGIIHGEIEIVRKWTPSLSKISPNWIGIGRYSWINTKESPFRYINHSCEPNTYIIGKRTVVALKSIEAEDEVTMDYSFTEADPGWSIPNCKCGSKECRGTIGPIFSLKPKTFQQKKSLIPENFKKIFLTEFKRKKDVGNFSY